MISDDAIKLAVYRHTARTGFPPAAAEAAQGAGITVDELKAAYARLAARRLLVLEPDGSDDPDGAAFLGRSTQHLVRSEVSYFANCAWDALGIPAALQRPAVVIRAASSRMCRSARGRRRRPRAFGLLFHCLVPAAQWWEDIVFT